MVEIELQELEVFYAEMSQSSAKKAELQIGKIIQISGIPYRVLDFRMFSNKVQVRLAQVEAVGG